MHLKPVTLFLTLLATAHVPAAAVAFVVPVQLVDEHPFPRTTDDVRIAEARIDVTRMSRQPEQDAGGLWWVEADLLVYNQLDATTPFDFVLADLEAHTDSSTVFVGGRAIACTPTIVERDPTVASYAVDHGLLCHLDLEPLGTTVIRVNVVAQGTIDALGVLSLRLPTHLLGAFADDIASASLTLRLDERPVGLLSTLSGGTIYDEPDPGVAWFARAWEPTLPFETSWLSPWSTLLLAAELERCPPPWDVVRGITGSTVTQTSAMLRGYDPATLEFCAGLPMVLHGAPVESASARAQLEQIDVSRYVAGPLRGSLYRHNPRFDETTLSEVEAIYRRALLGVLR